MMYKLLSLYENKRAIHASKSASYSEAYQLNANLKNLQPILIAHTTPNTITRSSLGHISLTYIGG